MTDTEPQTANPPSRLPGGFYLGTHRLGIARHFPKVFISANILWGRRAGFVVWDWVMDSAAFSQIVDHGRFLYDVPTYCRLIRWWAQTRTLRAAVTQDYMCEDIALAKTGLRVIDHQRLTIERYDELMRLRPPVYILPVLQGYRPHEYLDHLAQYGDRIGRSAWVGVGSVCKRNGTPEDVYRVLAAIKDRRPELRLHGFGLKTTSLTDPRVLGLLHSADSMAWSYHERRHGRDANGLAGARAFYERIQAAIKTAEDTGKSV